MPHKEPFAQLIESKFNIRHRLDGIEIGCFKGELTHHLLSRFEKLHMITIDPSCYWDDVLENNKYHLDRIFIIPMESDKAVKHIKGLFDFIFIDGDHSYEQCKKDILNYMPLIRPGGLIAGHNFDESNVTAHPGVHISVKEIFGMNYKLLEDFTWYVKKQ